MITLFTLAYIEIYAAFSGSSSNLTPEQLHAQTLSTGVSTDDADITDYTEQ